MSISAAGGSARGAETPEDAPRADLDNSEPADRHTGPRLIRHGACGKSWTGTERGHCGQCHETFSSGAFDAHQRIRDGVITCSTEKLEPHSEPWGTLWKQPGGYW